MTAIESAAKEIENNYVDGYMGDVGAILTRHFGDMTDATDQMIAALMLAGYDVRFANTASGVKCSCVKRGWRHDYYGETAHDALKLACKGESVEAPCSP